MNSYQHTVQYYETDKMGITHHANYIRWMEEARVDFLDQIGWGFDKLEAEGIVSPVTGLSCKYKASTTFPEKVSIDVMVAGLKGPVLKFQYVMTNQEGKTVFEGYSEHCFLDKAGRIVRLNKQYPALYELLQGMQSEGTSGKPLEG